MMSPPRWIASILSLTIFFANACCLAHLVPAAPVASHPKHACCKKAQQSDQKPRSGKPCECCERMVASVTSQSTQAHAPLVPVWAAIASIDRSFVLSPAFSSFHFDANAPPAAATDVLQQSCALIL
jgi:hypothetical protein